MARIDKLRELILHAGTPEAERRAALRQLERGLVGDAASSSRLPVTRSVRIGRRRQVGPLGEVERLDIYGHGRSYGEVLADILRPCRDQNRLPAAVDFGHHELGEPVIALHLAPGRIPDALALQAALRATYPGTRVTPAQRSPDDDPILLVYLGVEAAGRNRGAGHGGHGI